MSTVHNFNAGPAVLPADVLRKAQNELLDYRGLGYSIMEASHRSKEFDAVISHAETNFRSLLGLGSDYAVLFLQGGASLQFAMLAQNLMGSGGSADYVDTGSWSSKAMKEAKLFGDVRTAASSKASNYDHIPPAANWDLDPNARYLHITTNNTIMGTQFATMPKAPEGVPLVGDMSSDILSRPFDASAFGLIYAGAQKNLGPSGVTLAILRRDLAERCPANVPTMLRYDTHMDNGSMYNTPPTFGIYILGLVTDWVISHGGLDGLQKMNEAKAALIYDCIDADDFYRCPARLDSRSRMNICFRLPSEELEAMFLKEAEAAGMVGLKGHRAVGGLRASIYNASPKESAQALADLMTQFRAAHG